MSIVPLVSGGLDSTVMALLIDERGMKQHPPFVNYGQLGGAREWSACLDVFEAQGLPSPERIDLRGYGAFYPSGITTPDKDIYQDAFLPGRNALFLLVGAAHAFRVGATALAIGLLSQDTALFPDQTKDFTVLAESFLSLALGHELAVLTPLMRFRKSDVIRLGRDLGVEGTYSCHSGDEDPCGICISCQEFIQARS